MPAATLVVGEEEAGPAASAYFSQAMATSTMPDRLPEAQVVWAAPAIVVSVAREEMEDWELPLPAGAT